MPAHATDRTFDEVMEHAHHITMLPGTGKRCDECRDAASYYRRCACGATFAACGTHERGVVARLAACTHGKPSPPR